MLIYILIYIPFILCSLYDFYPTSEKKKQKILWFWVIVFTLFRGLRWEVGTDWKQFHDVFYQSQWTNIFNYVRYETWAGTKTMEWGYMLINTVVHAIGLNYTCFLLLTNYLIMYCLMDFSRKNTRFPIITLILLLNVGVPFPVRQTLSVAIAFWSYTYLVRNRYVIFFIAAFVAMSIHRGSAILFPLIIIPFVLNRYRIKWQLYLVGYFTTMFAGITLADYITPLMTVAGMTGDSSEVYLETYLSMENTSVDYGTFSNGMANGISYILFFLFLLFLKAKKEYLYDEHIYGGRFFFFLYFMSVCVDNLIGQGNQNGGLSEIMGRVSSTFDMFCVVFPLIFIYIIQELKVNRIFVATIFILYMIYKYWQQIPGSFYQDLYIPYKSVLSTF